MNNKTHLTHKFIFIHFRHRILFKNPLDEKELLGDTRENFYVLLISHIYLDLQQTLIRQKCAVS